MKLSQSSMLIAGIVLVVLTNAIVLGGAAYNRSGDPESLLKLSERELARPIDWGRDHDNSGVSIKLKWRSQMDDAAPKVDGAASFFGSGGSAPWLDNAKLIALGFDLPQHVDGSVKLEKNLSREVLLVLELNGPAYQQALQRTKELAVREEALKAAAPNSDEMTRRAKSADEQLYLEATLASRLFIVDAGLDEAKLRSSYPDRTRYAIVRGEVRTGWRMTGNDRYTRVGFISGMHGDSIHVPLAFQALLKPENKSLSQGRQVSIDQSEITVAFGRRLEPWIISAVKR